MGGVAKAVTTVAQFAYDSAATLVRTPLAIGQSLGKGEGIGTALGKGLKASVAPVVPIVKGAFGEIVGGGDKPAMPQAPAAPSATDQAATAEAQRRKSLTDLAKDRPGRNQTVLTDQSAYPYRLV